jgi:Mg2+ and Co2+ transporter CorA
VTFFVFERLLVTVRNAGSRTVEQVRTRLLEFGARRQRSAAEAVGTRTAAASGGVAPDGSAERAGSEPLGTRVPQGPEELMLRLVNGMVDRYLDLRQTLTDKVDGMQRELLDPHRSFSDWVALLDARIELRKLENLCEEQLDALGELRDAYVEATLAPKLSDAHLVRIADVIEHINRVLAHARRLEASVETAVQLHFSAMSHRTNQVVRTLTVVTVVFGVLTLIAGIWGMNVGGLPLATHPQGFAILVATMAVLAAALLGAFWGLRVLRDR